MIFKDSAYVLNSDWLTLIGCPVPCEFNVLISDFIYTVYGIRFEGSGDRMADYGFAGFTGNENIFCIHWKCCTQKNIWQAVIDNLDLDWVI